MMSLANNKMMEYTETLILEGSIYAKEKENRLDRRCERNCNDLCNPGSCGRIFSELRTVGNHQNSNLHISYANLLLCVRIFVFHEGFFQGIFDKQIQKNPDTVCLSWCSIMPVRHILAESGSEVAAFFHPETKASMDSVVYRMSVLVEYALLCPCKIYQK